MHFLCFTTVLRHAYMLPMEKQLIDALGGIRAVSEALQVDRSAVSNWRLEGRRIPWKHKPAIARLAADRAVSLPSNFWNAQ